MSNVAAVIRRPFVTQLRSRRGVVAVASNHAGIHVTVRVHLPEQWDTVAFDIPGDAMVGALKREALLQFGLTGAIADDYVVKLRGAEVRGDAVTVAGSGARDGSSFLLTYRRRRAVR